VKLEKNNSHVQGMCEKFLYSVYCKNNMSTICHTKSGWFN